MLHNDIHIQKRSWSNDRFVGFKGAKGKKELSKEINECIAICEKERPGYFNIEMKEDMSQDDFNRLHTWFEVYRGELNDPHPFFRDGSKSFRCAVERFNQLIHMWEMVDNYDELGNAAVTVDIHRAEYIDLDADDYENFELRQYPNTLTLSYIMRGKNIVDLYTDQDHDIGDENIRKYKYLGSTFVLNINGWTDEETNHHRVDFWTWFFENEDFLASIGFKAGDHDLSLGWIPLAHADIDNVKELIDNRTCLKDIRVL